MSYPSGAAVNLGNELTNFCVRDEPQVSWEAEEGVYYTLLMFDPDIPTRNNHTLHETRHWLVFNILGSDIEFGEVVFEYRGSRPPKDTGLHRYIFVVFKQPNGIIQHNETHVTKQ